MRIVIFALLLGWPAVAADLLIQGAVDSELGPLLGALRDQKEIHVAAWTFERFQPKAIINQGTAGAHNQQLQLWDIVVGERTTDYSAFRSKHGDAGAGIGTERWTPMYHSLRLDNRSLTPFPSFQGDERLVAAALKVKYDRGKVIKGNIGSAYQLHRELDFIQWLHKT